MARKQFSLLPAVLVVGILTGCGASAATPSPSATPAATPKPVYVDRSAGLKVSVLRVVTGKTFALLLVSMHNAGSTDYQSAATVPFRDTSFVEPTAGSSAAACDSDISRGTGLDYLSVAAHTTHTGWIRCDYPSTSHLFVLIWQNHNVGAFRITGS